MSNCVTATMKTPKAILPASAPEARPERQDSGIAARRLPDGCTMLHYRFNRLRTMEGLAPESRFSWLEVSHA